MLMIQELSYSKGQAIGILIQIGIVNLRRVACQNHFGPFSCARNDGLHLMRRQDSAPRQ